jgi:hypothetical protein
MTREVRTVLSIVTVVFLAAVIAPALGFGDSLLFLLVDGQWLVVLATAWGMLDAAYHRDSVWREADQNKVVWVLVQFIPVLGTTASYILRTGRCWRPSNGFRAVSARVVGIPAHRCGRRSRIHRTAARSVAATPRCSGERTPRAQPSLAARSDRYRCSGRLAVILAARR